MFVNVDSVFQIKQKETVRPLCLLTDCLCQSGSADCAECKVPLWPLEVCSRARQIAIVYQHKDGVN